MSGIDYRFATTVHTARKRYRCNECDHPIVAGERYDRSPHICDGQFHVWRRHVECGALADDYVALHGNSIWAGGWNGLIEEWITGAGHTREEAMGYACNDPQAWDRIKRHWSMA